MGGGDRRIEDDHGGHETTPFTVHLGGVGSFPENGACA
jgi:hypothetical protein